MNIENIERSFSELLWIRSQSIFYFPTLIKIKYKHLILYFLLEIKLEWDLDYRLSGRWEWLNSHFTKLLNRNGVNRNIHAHFLVSCLFLYFTEKYSQHCYVMQSFISTIANFVIHLKCLYAFVIYFAICKALKTYLFLHHISRESCTNKLGSTSSARVRAYRHTYSLSLSMQSTHTHSHTDTYRHRHRHTHTLTYTHTHSRTHTPLSLFHKHIHRMHLFVRFPCIFPCSTPLLPNNLKSCKSFNYWITTILVHCQNSLEGFICHQNSSI